MPSKTVQRLDATNVNILNAVRTDASTAYGQRIPAATQGSITDTVEALWNYRPLRNEFVDALVNRIGSVEIKSKTWTNPLATYKRGMMQWGDTIEEVYVDILKAKRYDPSSSFEDVWKRNPPKVYSNFHTIDRQDYYEVSVNDALLKRAFLSEYGLQDLVGSVLERPYTSDYFDEYLIMKNLFVEYARLDGFYKVNIPNPAAQYPDREYAAKYTTELIRAWTDTLTFMSSAYNAAHVTTASRREDLVLFCTPQFKALLDVNVVAQAFNRSDAQVETFITVIDDFRIDGCQAILADRDFFICADTLIDFESIRNPKAMEWNYWLHHHGVYSMSRFVNAIMFTYEAGTEYPIPDVTLANVTLELGYNPDGTQMTYAELGARTPIIQLVNGTIDPEDPAYIVPQGVTWEITATEGVINSDRTYIDKDGWLHVDPNETATSVTIQATTVFTKGNVPIGDQVPANQKTATITVPIGKPATTPDPDPGTEQSSKSSTKAK